MILLKVLKFIPAGNQYSSMIKYEIDNRIFYKISGTITGLDYINVEIYLITSETIENTIIHMTILGKYAKYIKNNEDLPQRILSIHAKYHDKNNFLTDDILCKIIHEEFNYYVLQNNFSLFTNTSQPSINELKISNLNYSQIKLLSNNEVSEISQIGKSIWSRNMRRR